MPGDMFTTMYSGLKVLEKYMWLLDSYVLDYFTGRHWNKLPPSWRTTLEDVEPQELGYFITQSCESYQRVWPLSLLALRVASSCLSVTRDEVNFNNLFEEQEEKESLCCDVDLAVKSNEPTVQSKQHSEDGLVINRHSEWQVPDVTPCLKHPRLKYVFSKHVKPKKRHEISRMAKVTASVAQMENCQFIVDIGSGLGHLARLLAYGYGLKVCCLEAQQGLSRQARKLDMELEVSVSKILDKNQFASLHRPVHLSMTLDSQLTANSFTEDLKMAFGASEEVFRFGIVGLHPCGDLAPILMHLFVECPNAKFINIVGCCYMKLSTGIVSGFNGYPMSKFLCTRPHSLSYGAREIACHAIEVYCQRLCVGQYEDLKVHCYRAVLEKILTKHWPHLRHTMIKSIKHTTDMTFHQYITLALSRLGLEVPIEDVTSEETEINLLEWRRVVSFYTLRLMLAPLVESVLLRDRQLYLQELGVYGVTYFFQLC
ncbi:methyltransferase-like protein 25B isoform X2 [Periplaneta americana]|uniref:methyltransferase-like protein 25B isoform X2 n=1 Tax=Periplaneta americana TaxID=6978 RepID=UPI0037E8E5AE